MSERTLRITFDSLDALRREFAENIANGGIFVETNVAFEVRESVHVEVCLVYAGDQIDLDGEVVHVIPPELAVNGARAGVAVHFARKASEIRELFRERIGDEVDENEEQTGSGVRRSRRVAVVLDAHIETAGGEVVGETRNVSRGGALVNVGAEADVKVGQTINVAMTRAESGSSLRVPARVVRSQEAEEGEGQELGVEFDISDEELAEVGEFVDEVRVEEHKRKLGGISGAIQELGIEHLLQMFCNCSPQGTLTVFRREEEGYAIFEGGLVRAVRLGSAKGRKALARILEWREGTFEFHSKADLDGIDDDPLPLDAALLEAMRLLDESQHGHFVTLPPGAHLQVEAEAVAGAGSALTKGESAIVELAQVGMTVERILDVVPEPDAEVMMLMSGLVERGLITVAE